jgi:hypothetical protein
LAAISSVVTASVAISAVPTAFAAIWSLVTALSAIWSTVTASSAILAVVTASSAMCPVLTPAPDFSACDVAPLGVLMLSAGLMCWLSTESFRSSASWRLVTSVSIVVPLTRASRTGAPGGGAVPFLVTVITGSS